MSYSSFYIAKASDKYATAFANSFLETIVCDDGITPPSVESWNMMASQYSALEADSKDMFINGVAEQYSSDVVEQMLARYSYIINKYNNNGVVYQEFIIGRTLVTSNSALNTVHENNKATIIIVVSALLLISTASVIYLAKKSSLKQDKD